MTRMLIVALFCLPLSAGADELQERQAASAESIKAFSGRLKGELEQAMQEGGPRQAVEVCNRIAPAIAEEQSRKHGWRMGRTSLQTRNPDNAPDAWETRVLKDFEARKAKGEPVEALVHSEVVEQDGNPSFRFMKAIPTGEVCLKCHGDIEPGLATQIDQLYPQDRARGFRVGDIRGAFTITQPMR